MKNGNLQKKNCAFFQRTTPNLGVCKQFFVNQDLSDRVKHNRKIFGERMMRVRNNGRYASIRYCTLFVNDSISNMIRPTRLYTSVSARDHADRDTIQSVGAGTPVLTIHIESPVTSAKADENSDQPISRTTDQLKLSDDSSDV